MHPTDFGLQNYLKSILPELRTKLSKTRRISDLRKCVRGCHSLSGKENFEKRRFQRLLDSRLTSHSLKNVKGDANEAGCEGGSTAPKPV